MEIMEIMEIMNNTSLNYKSSKPPLTPPEAKR